MRTTIIGLLLAMATGAFAQIGEHRNELAVGVNGGYVLSNVKFVPTVSQGLHGGVTGGLSVRYTCEKYFKSICAIVAEVNYASIGWKQDILDQYDEAVVNSATGETEQYSRTINYLQIPFMARLGWGRERKGFQAFFQIGPQFGLYLSESTSINYDPNYRNLNDRINQEYNQESMAVENKFDYGIAGGLGLEFSRPGLGHFIIEGRYYYGLGNIYGDSKLDHFSRSNFNNIVIKATYLFDLIKTKNDKIK